MKFTRVKTTVMAGLMAASMLAPGMTAFADDISAKTGLTFTKTVNVADSITVPERDLEFTATQQDSDAATTGNQNADGTTQPKDVNPVTIKINTKGLVNGTDGWTSHKKSADLSGLEAACDANGEYTFLLTESSTDDLDGEGYGWDMNTTNKSYYLHVYVSDGEDGKVYEYLVTTDNSLGDQSKKVSDAGFEFVNKYTKKGGVTPVNPDTPDPDPINPDGEDDQGNTYSLAIAKQVDGTNAKYADAFTFTVDFADSTTNSVPAAGYKYTIVSSDTIITDSTTYDQTWDSTHKTLKLEDGQKAVFQNIPAGIKVTVVESKEPNTTATKATSYMNGDTTGVEKSYTKDSTSWTSEQQTIGEHRNSIIFTNTYTDDIIITGVVTDVAPYITLVVFAVAAVAAYVAMKSRVAR